VRFIFKVTALNTMLDLSTGDFDALMVSLEPEKAREIRELVRLCNVHDLSEARRDDRSITLFDLPMLHDCEDIEPRREVELDDITRAAEESLERGMPYAVPADFEFPEERAVDLREYRVELTAYDNEFFWTITHLVRPMGWESQMLTIEQLDFLLAPPQAAPKKRKRK
jgi:hypothetical protein